MKPQLRKSATSICSFETAIRPVVLLGQLFGLCSINVTNNNGKILFEQSTAKAFYALGVTVAYFVISILNFINADIVMTTNVSIFHQLVRKYIPFSLVVANLLLLHFRRVHFIKFLKILHSVDYNLTQLTVHLDYKSFRKQFYIEVMVSTVISFFVSVCHLYLDKLLFGIMNTMTLLIVVAAFSKFIGCLQMLKRRFAIINNEMNLWETRNNISVIQDFNSTLLIPLNKLTTLAMSHDALCEAAHYLNGVFTVQMLIYAGLVFLGSLFAIFSDFRVLFGIDTTSTKTVAEQITENSVISIFMFSFMVKVLYECSTTCEEVSTY